MKSIRGHTRISDWRTFALTKDALFNVENATFYVEENDGPVNLCIVLADGCLERDVVLTMPHLMLKH
jgi:hypothetical protein